MVVLSLPFLVLQPTVTRLEALNSTTLELEWKVGLCNMQTSNMIEHVEEFIEYSLLTRILCYLPCLAEKQIQLRCTWAEGVCVSVRTALCGFS